MKKLIFIIALLSGLASAQSTTITGTIKDLTGANVTSGKVTFTLQPSRDTTISGTARFSPLQVVCLINASGQIVALDGSSACTVTTNTSLQPTGSYYRVDVWPGNVKTSSFNFYAVNASYDWSTVVPTPTTSPADNFVDVFSNQTIGGNKIWSGTQTFNGNNVFNGADTFNALQTFAAELQPSTDNTIGLGDTTHRWQGFFGTSNTQRLNGIRLADQFTGANCGAKINAADADLGAIPGEIWVNQACGLTIATPVTLSAKHVLRFIQGGVWVQTAAITMLDDAGVVGPPTGRNEDVLTLLDPGVTFQQPASTNLAALFVVKGQNVSLSNIAIDGNYRAGGNGSTVGIAFDNTAGAPNNRGRFRAFHISVENCGSDGLQVLSDVAGNNQGIGAHVFDSAFSRNHGHGVSVTRSTDTSIYHSAFELNDGSGVRSIDSTGTISFSDLSTNNGAQFYASFDATASSFIFMQGGWSLISNGITTTAVGSGLDPLLNSSVIINGYNGTSCGMGGMSTITLNTISVQSGVQTDTIDAIRLIDTNTVRVTGNNIISGAGGTYKFKYGIDDTHSGSCASVFASTYSGNSLVNAFSSGYYNLNTAANAFGNIFGTTSQEQRTRTSSTCATAASVGAVCTSVVTWPNAFSDTNYNARCTGDLITSGVPVDGGLSAKAAGSVTFRTVATTAAAAQFTTIDCSAVHD
jgi:hypothetical protein